ncbi:MAG: CHAT domain-containing protein, partial [Dolichospermum sp.]
AQFGTIPDDTFLVAGNNDKITLKSLENTLRLLKSGSNSVELLTLTACETAEGDERSALGLAGVAIQAGVQSAIASLWPVSDQSTLQLILAFYDNLINSGVNKAEALREAQIQLIQAQSNPDINNQYSHPVYWSSF